MAINLNDNIKVLTGKPVDAFYLNSLTNQPYTNLAEVRSSIDAGSRSIGLTVLVDDTEYWWRDGTEDSDLIAKLPPLSTVATTGNYSDLIDPPQIIGGSGVTTTVDAYGDVTIDFDTSDSLNSLTVDNLTLDGNTISSSNIDGLILEPGGTSNLVTISGDLILRDDPLSIGETRTITLIGERNSVNNTAYAQINLDNFDADYGTEGTQYTGASIKAFLSADAADGGGHLTFSTANGTTLSEAMRIDHLGNVGIGTTEPSTTLRVVGSFSTDNLTLDDNTISSSTGNITIDPEYSVIIDGDLILRDDPLSAGQTRTITLVGERFGSADYTLTEINFDNYEEDADPEPITYTAASIRTYMQSDANGGGQLVFSTSNVHSLAEAMRIDHLGNVGIGKTPGTATKLDVNGATKTTSLTINDYSLPTTTGSAGQAIIANDNGTTSFQDISTTLTVNADNVNPATISLLSDQLIISGAGSVNTSVDAYGEVTVSVDLENVSTDIEITNAAKGVILRSPNGNRWRITVDDNGNLTTTIVVP